MHILEHLLDAWVSHEKLYLGIGGCVAEPLFIVLIPAIGSSLDGHHGLLFAFDAVFV